MSDLKIGLKVKEELMRKAAAETTVVRKSLRSKPEQVGSRLLQCIHQCTFSGGLQGGRAGEEC